MCHDHLLTTIHSYVCVLRKLHDIFSSLFAGEKESEQGS